MGMGMQMVEMGMSVEMGMRTGMEVVGYIS